MIKKIVLKIIRFYQEFVSPMMGHHCRFYPSCSEYAVKTIQKHGALKGTKKGFLRVLRCHPFNKGGVDLPL